MVTLSWKMQGRYRSPNFITRSSSLGSIPTTWQTVEWSTLWRESSFGLHWGQTWKNFTSCAKNVSHTPPQSLSQPMKSPHPSWVSQPKWMCISWLHDYCGLRYACHQGQDVWVHLLKGDDEQKQKYKNYSNFELPWCLSDCLSTPLLCWSFTIKSKCIFIPDCHVRSLLPSIL